MRAQLLRSFGEREGTDWGSLGGEGVAAGSGAHELAILLWS